MKKIIKWSVLVLVLLVVGGLLVVYLNLNSIVRATVESQTQKSLNVTTTLDSARLALFGGSVSLNDLKIGSPQGYSAPQMFTLEGVSVNASLGELRQDPIRVGSIVIDKPHLVLERSGTRFNFQALMDQMPQDDAPADPNEEPIRLVIGELRINNAVVALMPGIPGLPEEVTIPIPSVYLKDIGTGEGAENGAAINDVIMQVITALSDEASRSDLIPPEVRELLSLDLGQMKAQLAAKVNQRLGEAQAQVREKAEQAKEQASEEIDKVRQEAQSELDRAREDAKKELQGGLDGLLNRPKEEKK